MSKRLTKKAKIEKIANYLKDTLTEDLIRIYNEYCYEVNNSDDIIYSNDEDTLQDLIEGEGAYWILCRAFYGKYNPNDEYFKFDGYGNFQSFTYEQDVLDYIDETEIADYCVENDVDFEDDEIREILDIEELFTFIDANEEN